MDPSVAAEPQWLPAGAGSSLEVAMDVTSHAPSTDPTRVV